jgi:hypothetical protein
LEIEESNKLAESLSAELFFQAINLQCRKIRIPASIGLPVFKPNAIFKIEHWYHLLIVIGSAGAIASMTVELKGVANAHALLTSLGILFIGIGEWVNHPLQTKLVAPNAYFPGGGKITAYPRRPRALGSLFDLLGAVLIGIAIYKITQASE